MESQRKPSSEQWAPWIEDPDEPVPPMTDEESKAAAKKAMALLKKKQEEAKKHPSR